MDAFQRMRLASIALLDGIRNHMKSISAQTKQLHSHGFLDQTIQPLSIKEHLYQTSRHLPTGAPCVPNGGPSRNAGHSKRTASDD